MPFDIQIQSARSHREEPPPQEFFLEDATPERREEPSRIEHDFMPRKKPRWWPFFLFLLVFIAVPGLFFLKSQLETHGEQGAAALQTALKSAEAGKLSDSVAALKVAEKEFQAGKNLLFGWGVLLDPLRYVPSLSRVSAGRNLIEAGGHLARAGESIIRVSEWFSNSANTSSRNLSLLELLGQGRGELLSASQDLHVANGFIQKVSLSDLPQEKRATFEKLQRELPTLSASLDLYLNHTALLEELLGGNGPRKYLFLFQNNNEIRATGGFIGTYALLDVTQGDVRRFFVDGIFNPDGQLRENIVPPTPIKKISAAWSLHDSNWFPDFPVSAEKAIFFYEKTGGPTVDGVITITPAVLERLLKVTGPLELPDYGVTIDEKNFMPIIQEQVEEKYDKTENNPKRILSDLSDALLGKLLSFRDATHLRAVSNALVEALNERDILLYSRHPEAEALIDGAGWSGRILETSHDYVSVVNSNINGYKTDGVIQESIEHRSVLQKDGSIVDTIKITRRHMGGNTPYTWWNKVNANYMRIYVPKGSELLSAKGMTREVVSDPLDYDALEFKRDPDVLRTEAAEKIDPESGTHIGEDAGKTVFGNWVYVSPQESVTVEYTYRLPERIPDKALSGQESFAYSILYQKQPGSEGVELRGSIEAPEGFVSVWQTGENLVRYMRALTQKSAFDKNQIIGSVLRKEGVTNE